ncbi:hypothetical protein Bpfe_016090 [Biomphalaria pfeifferi]|uniref:TNFR-Cys domain-containing protein n=1 Tax=Biomphalaria pfeifferi TaxID=112525 RepID=A0AAD8F915_BIOPF|nr:hypothetical protein Bpfe_016090 [Biomphalaria pfeifferi]
MWGEGESSQSLEDVSPDRNLLGPKVGIVCGLSYTWNKHVKVMCRSKDLDESSLQSIESYNASLSMPILHETSLRCQLLQYPERTKCKVQGDEFKYGLPSGTETPDMVNTAFTLVGSGARMSQVPYYHENSTEVSQSPGNPTSAHGHAVHHDPPAKFKVKFSSRAFSILFFAALLLLVLTVAVSKLHTKPTLHVTFPASNTLRKVRMFSDFPELTKLSKDHSSLSLLSRLQLVDAHRCTGDFKSCQIAVVCDTSTDQSINCRCRPGYFFKDWKCHACTSTCPSDHYLVSSCNSQSDALCKRCTACGPTQYEAAPCTTQRDTICVDVSFPVGILPMNKSYLPDDGIHIAVSHSANIFMERLINMEALETPMYITNNQQSLDFVWPRLSGLDIDVSISGVFLVPDYHDVDVAEDDTALFQKLNEPSQKMKDNYHTVQYNYCRHPVPDYYSLQLEIIANRTSSAQLVRCNSKDESVPRCPQNYKDGDRYLKWNINTPCAHMNAQRLDTLKDGPNSIVCTEETDILRKVFQATLPTTEEYMFPSRDCDLSRQECEKCLSRPVCPATSNRTEEAFLQDNLCCGLKCYLQNHCKKYYSFSCPQPTVECAKGDVNIFSLFPHFDSIERQFSCHLKYQPPTNLYSLSYTIRAPSINFNTTPQHFTVSATSKEDHGRRLSSFDFINALHDTRFKVQDDLILIGDHPELRNYIDSLMKPFIVREIKSPKELMKKRTFTSSSLPKQAFIQFEKPFLYSSLSWHKDGCNKNMSKVYPNQTIYKEEDYVPIMARKTTLEGTSSTRHAGYSYQMYHRDKAPYIKFYVEKGKSVLQYLQGSIVKGKLNPNSLYGKVSWHHESATWKLTFSGLQENCPTVISLKIFTQLMTGCAGYFDILINCPEEFSVEFTFVTNKSDLPDIFVVQVNDSVTTHNLVLSSMYTPVHVDEVVPENAETSQEVKSADYFLQNYTFWLPLFFIVVISLLLLLAVCIAYNCINKNVATFKSPNTSGTEGETQTLNNHGETSANSVLASKVKPGKDCIIKVFIFLYVIYCAVFSFTLTYCLVYYIQSSTWSNFSTPGYLGKQLLNQVNKSLAEIQAFEDQERLKLFDTYQKRRKSCIYHLENESKRLLHDYESATKKQLEAMFMDNGTVYSLSNAILQQNVSAYLGQINEFITNCNKTIHAIVDRFQANYFLFLRNVALNDWLQVPRQIFLYQDGEDINRKYLSSTQVKQFATWLGIDKADELLAVGENVFGRLSSIQKPQVPVLNIEFPPISPHLMTIEPKFDYDSHSYIYTVLAPSPAEEQIENNSIKLRMKREADEFNLSGNLKVNPDNEDFSSSESKSNKAVLSRRKSHKNYEGYYSERTPKSVVPEYGRRKSDEYSHGKLETTVVGIQSKDESLIKNSEALKESDSDDSKKESINSSEEDSTNFYILIGIFVTLDLVLLAYRVSWLSDQLYATRNGYVDRIPTDDTCKHVLEIQTAYHLPAFENPLDESSGFYVDTKEQLYTEKEPEMTFLQDFPKSKENDILQKIWNKKKNKTNEVELKMQRCFLVRWYYDVKKFFQRSFMSPLVWQGSITFLAVIFLCIFIYCMNFWLTEDHFRSLVGGQFAAADVHWHLETSSRYLHGLAAHLTDELKQIKEMCDLEIATLTDMFFATVNMQSFMFTKTLVQLCQEAKKADCEELNIVQFLGGRIVGCNFLPIQAQTFHDLSLSVMEAFIDQEVRPIVQLSQWTLTLVTSLIAALLCGRLLCHATASTIRHFMLLSDRLPRVRVYQAEDNRNSAAVAMHHSQSWVDSCESGVYLGETDEANKEENR